MRRDGIIRFLNRWVVPVVGRRRSTLARQLDAVEQRLLDAPTRDEIDAFKSSLDVPQSLINDFEEWKRTAILPDEPLVSIAMATYNRARLLAERAIPSLLAQTYRNIEIIVVGDACTDDTAARLEAIRDPRLKFVNLPQRGSYPAAPELRWMVAGTTPINEALRLAAGDFITHLDDDDEHLPHRIEDLVSFAQHTGAEFIWHPFWWEVEPGTWVLNDAPTFSYLSVTTSSVFYRSWFKRIPWDINAFRLREPGDWNRFRKIRYIGPEARRFPEPLLRHYRERNDGGRTQ